MVMCSAAPAWSTGTTCLSHKLQEQGRHPVAGPLAFLCEPDICPPSEVTALWQSKRWGITIFWQWRTGNTHPSSHFPSWQNTAVTAAQSWVSLSQVTGNQSLPAAFLIRSDISVIMIFTVMFMILVIRYYFPCSSQDSYSSFMHEPVMLYNYSGVRAWSVL